MEITDLGLTERTNHEIKSKGNSSKLLSVEKKLEKKSSELYKPCDLCSYHIYEARRLNPFSTTPKCLTRHDVLLC